MNVRRPSPLALAAMTLAFLGAAEPSQMSCAADLSNFITKRGDQLFDGNRPYRFISFNIPNLMVIEDAYEFTQPNPWRWPDEFEIEDSFESVRQMGGRVVRTYVLSVFREGSDMGNCVHVRGPGQFSEEGFRTLDKVIEVARRKGIRVIIPFVDQAKWWGGIGEYAAFRGKTADEFWTDRQLIDDFKKTIHFLLTRKNTYTGVEYRNEPAIFGWETGNEIKATPEWTREIAAYLKALDKQHLVIDGNSLHGVPQESLDDPNVDVITTHHYPFGEDHDFAKPIRAAHALTKGKKPYFVGEFGFVEMPHIASAINTVVDDGISGALLWSLRMHRREGGFYWHMEVGTGRNIYKAFHWPGFASGDRYDEREVLKLVRDNAFRIQGVQPPPLEKPAPPKLLPIERVSAISWQGSAGAASYDVWRALDANNNWHFIAQNLSDADTQYRPLFNDATAEPGKNYRYRVVAGNSGGESGFSNEVGPVVVTCRTFVDECRDLSLVAKHEGDVQATSENARTTQEDCHRLKLASGSSITYRVEGPVSGIRAFSFANHPEIELEVSGSADGLAFEPIAIKRDTFSSGQTVYGYLTPVLLSGRDFKPNVRFIRFGVPTAAGLQTKATGNRASNQPTVEISRVEIEYDQARDSAAQMPSAEHKPCQLNSSVFVYCGQPIEPALKAIDAAAERGEKQLNVVVTVMVDLTEKLQIKSFGINSGPELTFHSGNDAMRAELKAKLSQVFGRMIKHGMDIAVLPHIDAGGKVQQWRNWIDFEPNVSYGDFSYGDFVLDSIAEALAETVSHDTRVELALSGEMGTSLFRYPASYREITQSLRNKPKMKNLKIGISLNHGGIAGEGNPVGTKDVQLSAEQREQMQGLIDDCDFVGMSFYAPVRVSPTRDDFVNGVNRFIDQFEQHGLTVPTSKPLQFSEVGIGGRRLRDGVGDPEKAAATPWEGSAFARNNPWSQKPMQQLRREFHAALLDFLQRQPARWPVTGAFVWSMGSWDPLGHGEPTFADAQIMDAVEKHNQHTTKPSPRQ